MPRLAWKNLLSLFANGTSKPASAPRRTRLWLEELEDRAVPAASPTVDLTTAGATGFIGDVLFRQYSPQPTGTGYIDSFVRLQAKGAGTQAEQGYNTDARPLQFDENTSPQFTRSLLLSNVPLVNIGGIQYREFLLDINQKASQPYLSLDQLRIFVGSNGSALGYASGALAGTLPVYNMDATGDNWVKLDSRLSHGSGSGDMLLYVPDSDFTNAGASAGSYVYLYSSFGANYIASAGFEEWAVGKGGVSVTQQSGEAGGSISGFIMDCDGTTPDAGVVVFLDANNNGVLDSNEVYTTTDATGAYTFSGLATGLGSLSTYMVTVLDTSTQAVIAYASVSLQSTNETVTNLNFTYCTDSGYGSGLGA